MQTNGYMENNQDVYADFDSETGFEIRIISMKMNSIVDGIF